MSTSAESTGTRRQLMGVIGTLLLLAIIAVKLSRHLEVPIASQRVAGVLPSLFGPAGLLFLIRSGTGRLSRLSLLQSAVLVGLIAVGLEVAQLIPRPGFLERVNYTFDGLDLGASVLSVVGAYFLVRAMARPAAVV